MNAAQSGTGAAGQAPYGLHDWIVPDWPAPAGVHAVCTTRAGGISRPPYDGLNVGLHVGDDAVAVQHNREHLQAALQSLTPQARCVFLNQVHGTEVLPLQALTPDGATADASVASMPGMVCTIMVADCLPVLFAHRSGAAVAGAHAGWRGLAHGVLETTFDQLCSAVPQAAAGAAFTDLSAPLGAQKRLRMAQDTLAWLGPCIGPTAFEVGAEVRAAFCAHMAQAEHCFVPCAQAPGKYLCDLAGLARLRLQALGITQIYGNDSQPPWCTYTNASRFFSHRRDSVALGGSGRLAACIWRDGR